MANRPREDSTSSTFGPQKAEVSIDVAIVGASVSGLACAYALRQAGHSVRVLEAESSMSESPGGARVPPNMTRILEKWGLGPALREQTLGRCPGITFYSAYDGELIGEAPFHEKVMEALEAEVYLIHHTDLLAMLYNLARDAGAEISFGCQVTSIDPELPCVTTSSGEKIRVDLIVGADGDRSIVRNVLESEEYEDEDVNTYTTYLFTLPKSLFQDDSEIMKLTKEPLWNVFMGSDWCFLIHPTRMDKELSVTFFVTERETTASTGWKQKVPIKDLDLDSYGFSPMLRRLMGLAGDAIRTKDERLEPLEHWSDDMGHLVLIGEAVHRLNPQSSHGGALGVEDSVVLGRLLSRLKSKDDIKHLLDAFQEIRQARCAMVRISEQQKINFASLPSGPMQKSRDQSLRAQLVNGAADWMNADEAYLRKSWDEFFEVFGYDAYDDADTWWVEWGVLMDRVNEGHRVSNGNIFAGQVIVAEQAVTTD